MTDQNVPITQAMIDAYDEYTHLSLDRRGFMQKLTGLAGSATAAAAIAPLLAASSAKADVIAADDNRLTITEIEFAGGTGPVKGYQAAPANATGPLPTVIVIHENRGLNNHIRDVTRRMALDGFVAMAPDFLSVAGGTPSDEDKAREMIGALDKEVTLKDAIGAGAYLRSVAGGNGKVGAVGFCWGGGLVNRLAGGDPSLGAGVAYYGAQLDAAAVPAIKAPLMLHYAGLDDRINKGIADYEAALKANGKDYQIFIYDGVNHAFNNDTSSARYNKEAADLAWSRTTAFFKEKLA